MRSSPVSTRRFLIVVLIGLLLLPPTILLALAATESGSRWAVRAAARQWVPGLSVDDLRGSLLHGLRMRDVRFQDTDGQQAHLDSLIVRWVPTALLGGRIHLRALEAEGLRLRLSRGDGSPVHPPTSIALPLVVRFDQVSLRHVLVEQGQEQWRLGALMFSGRADQHGLRLDSLRAEAEGWRLSVNGRVSLNYPYAFALHGDWGVGAADTPELAGGGELSGDIARISIKQALRLPYQAHIAGTLMPDLEAGRHQFDVTAAWNELVLPIGEQTLHTWQGTLAVKGELNAYELSMATRLRYSAMSEAFDVSIMGHGGPRRLDITDSRLHGLGGQSLLSGWLSWQPPLAAAGGTGSDEGGDGLGDVLGDAWGVAWDVELKSDGIDPGRQWSEWPGALALDARLHGGLHARTLKFETQVRRLQGKLRGYPLDAKGQLSLKDGNLSVRDLKVRSGDNRARLDGLLHPKLGASLELDAGDLRQLMPRLAGGVRGQISLHGDLHDPAVRARLQGRALAFEGTRVGELSVSADIDPASVQASRWSLRASDIAHQGRVVASLDITGQGNASQHKLSAKARSADIETVLRASGAYAERQWRGELAALTVSHARLGRWQLDTPAALRAGHAELSLAPVCLTQAETRFCASGNRRPDGSLYGSGQLEGLPLALFKPWLGRDAELVGTVSGEFEIEDGGAWPRAEASFRISPGTLRYKSTTGPELIAEHHDGHVVLRYHEDIVEAEFGLGMGHEGRLRGTGRIGPAVSGSRGVQGELELGLSDPGPLGALVPRFSHWSGAMDLRARVAGTLAHPTLQLNGSWRDGQVQVPELGISLSAIQVGVKGDGDRLTLEGRATSGKGAVQLRGDAELNGAAGWPVRLRIEGRDFETVRRSDLAVNVSPRLDVELNRQLFKVTGTLAIPYARIEVEDNASGVVRVSPDEVIVSEQTVSGNGRHSHGPPVHARIRVVLGDDVRPTAPGLRTRLAGELAIHQSPGTPLEVVGQLNLLEGRYEAYGQSLNIEQGRVLFAGPVSSADISVQAVRKIDKLRVGLSLSGPLNAPSMSLFSEPAMDEANILSYLLTGGPLSGGKQLNAAVLTQAAVNLGLDKTTPITARIADAFGLDELGVVSTTGSSLESSAIAIGKQLTPDLYVRYLYGLFAREAMIQLRYKLNEHLRLEGGAGTQGSVDLLYEIESK